MRHFNPSGNKIDKKYIPSLTKGALKSKKIKHPYVRRADEPIEAVDLSEASIEGHPLAERDANFQNELEYDGYERIEDYDNDAFSFKVDGKQDPEHELDFIDREEKLNAGEESLIDPQEHYERD